MKKNKCINCSEHRNCSDTFTSWIFFIIGIVATVAIRVVTVLIHLNPIYAKLAWYIGIGGFLAFFIYKYKINLNRARSIERHNLLYKMNEGRGLTRNDYDLVGSILCGLGSKKERINYFFIFGLSAVALLLALYMDFLK